MADGKIGPKPRTSGHRARSAWPYCRRPIRGAGIVPCSARWRDPYRPPPRRFSPGSVPRPIVKYLRGDCIERGKQPPPLHLIVETPLRQLSNLPRLNTTRVFTVAYKLSPDSQSPSGRAEQAHGLIRKITTARLWVVLPIYEHTSRFYLLVLHRGSVRGSMISIARALAGDRRTSAEGTPNERNPETRGDFGCGCRRV